MATMALGATLICKNAQSAQKTNKTVADMDWDNLKFFLELSRAGKLTAAARRMGVDHTTVSRRIQALEKSLGLTLFIREQTGYSLTGPGQLLQVEQMESASVRIEQSLPDADEQLSGQVRIGATEGYGTVMLSRELGQLTGRYPHLHVDLLAMPRPCAFPP